MQTITWQDPPPAERGRTHRFAPDILAALRANPGRWALVIEGHTNSSVATHFRRRNPEYEVSVRSVRDTHPRRYDIYARYVGEVEA